MKLISSALSSSCSENSIGEGLWKAGPEDAHVSLLVPRNLYEGQLLIRRSGVLGTTHLIALDYLAS